MQDTVRDRFHLFGRIFPVCRQLLPAEVWHELVTGAETPDQFISNAEMKTTAVAIPSYLSELARLEFYIYTLSEDIPLPAEYAGKLTVNPTLELFQNTWKNLWYFFDDTPGRPDPEKGPEHIIVWAHPASRNITIKPVSKDILLALKMVVEDLSVHEVAAAGNIHPAAVENILIRALHDGILIGPQSRLKRKFKPHDYPDIDRSFFSPRIFSMQWHITQACDLHCRHCYDRNQYSSLSLEEEIRLLDDLADFCSTHNIHGQVTFTGGNPFLHPNFERLYREGADRGFTLAILGNPTPREKIVTLIDIQPPAFFQVSLEGLEEHNDYIRGKGHFRKTLAFLDQLRDLNIFSMVMLTLTRDNMDQVLPLAEILNSRADLFTFNRLSLVGEGAKLTAVDRGKYPEFLERYMQAVEANPCLGLKDNLMNIHCLDQNRSLFGGCTGFGCGAAFNFISVLADGSVHACRKFPSPLGTIKDQTLSELYHSEIAKRYRRGAAECEGCAIRPVCGGCLAVAYSHGLDVFTQKDPYCFIDSVNS